MRFMEDRWQRRQDEQQQQAAAAAQRAAAERAALEAELISISLSTLCTAPRPFEQVEIIQSEPSDDVPSALLNLKLAARTANCDAVLGVGISRLGSIGHMSFAYGTGVRWLPSDSDQEPT